MARVEKREAPAKRGETRDEAVLDIAFGSERMARVTTRTHMLGRDYLDFLTLVRDDTEWRIVSKVFTYKPEED